MLYVRPDYYYKFKCAADRCEATCCAGWQIVVDEESLARYGSETGEYGETLRNRIDWEEGVFRQDCRKRCAFLKDNNLCEMYEKLGEESLCFTCTNYPRHIEEFENLREITLAISCPEVARIILEQNEPVRFVEEEIESEEEELEDFDPFFFSYLEDARAIMLNLLQNRSLSIGVRAALVRNMAEEMQQIVEEADLFDLADVFEKYEEETGLSESIRRAEKEISNFYDNAEKRFLYSKEVFCGLYQWEHLADDWENYLDRCGNVLYGDGIQGYQKLQNDFKESFTCADLENLLEQLLVYFIFAYFCGAVYDENIAGRVKMSVDSVHVICELLAAAWKEQNRCLSLEDVKRIVYRYSRELEHSDANLEISLRYQRECIK